jgi:predicted membrane channel-forming protein YqfA (hemolysin III family)
LTRQNFALKLKNTIFNILTTSIAFFRIDTIRCYFIKLVPVNVHKNIVWLSQNYCFRLLKNSSVTFEYHCVNNSKMKRKMIAYEPQ